jgi:hypothetical protein
LPKAGALLDQRGTSRLQGLENKKVPRHGRIRLLLQGSPHSGQHAGVDGIGPGSRPCRLGEAARLLRVDLDQRHLARERHLEGPVIGAGRLMDDTGDRRLAEPLEKGAKAARRVLEPLRGPILAPEGVEMVFGHVDADGGLCHLLQSYPCHAWRKHA